MNTSTFAASLDEAFNIPRHQQNPAQVEQNSDEVAPWTNREVQELEASQRGDLENCKTFLNEYEAAHPNYDFLEGRTPWLMFLLAIVLKRHTMIQKLLEPVGRNSYRRGLKSDVLLQVVFAYSDLNTLKILHAHDAKLFEHDFHSGLDTAPGIACRYCKDPSMISYMLDHDVQLKPQRFSQPLDSAIRNGLPLSTIEKFVEKGAPVESSSLELAIEGQHVDVVRYILDHVRGIPPTGSILHKAYETNNQAMIDLVKQRNLVWRMETFGGRCFMIRNLRQNVRRRSTAARYATEKHHT